MYASFQFRETNKNNWNLICSLFWFVMASDRRPG